MAQRKNEYVDALVEQAKNNQTTEAGKSYTGTVAQSNPIRESIMSGADALLQTQSPVAGKSTGNGELLATQRDAINDKTAAASSAVQALMSQMANSIARSDGTKDGKLGGSLKDGTNVQKGGKPETTPTTPTTDATGGNGGGDIVSIIDADGNKTDGIVAGESPQQELDYWTQLKNLYDDMYNKQVTANNDAAAAAAQQAADAAQRQIDALNTNYSNLNKELYRNYLMNQKGMGQQLALQGYTGGASESAMNKLMNAYQEGLISNEQARAGEQSSIEGNLASQNYQTEANKAAANLQALQDRQNLDAQILQQQRSDAATKASNLAQVGNFSGYKELGYSQDEVDYMTRYWLESNPTMKAAWVAQNPEEAKRLGITVATRTRSTTTDTETEPSDDGKTLGTEVKSLITQGAKPADVSKAIDTAYQSGEITAAAALAAKMSLISAQFTGTQV